MSEDAGSYDVTNVPFCVECPKVGHGGACTIYSQDGQMRVILRNLCPFFTKVEKPKKVDKKRVGQQKQKKK